MKRFVTVKIIMALSVAAASLAGCTKTEESYQYVNLSQVSCSFLGEGSQSLAITVKASPATWEATPGATWVKVERTDDRTLTVTVEDNETGAERSTVINIAAGQATQEILVSQLAKDSEFARFRKLDTFQMGAAMSPSGKYAGGFEASVGADDSWQYSPTIVDLETGEWHQFGPFPESLYYLHQTMAITDQGLLFISDGQNGGQIAIDLTGDIFIPEAPAGYSGKPEIQGTSADGKYWVGFAMDKTRDEGGLYRPLLWTDGTPKELPILDLNYRDEEIWVGVMARGISADGRIIYGTSWENSDFGMLYWINEGGNTAAPKWVGEDVREVTETEMEMPDGTPYDTHIVNGLICEAQLTKISPSGKWIASTYRTEAVAEDRKSLVLTHTAAFYNTETETTTIVEDYGESTGMHVTDDGIAFVGIGTLGISTSKVYDLNTNTDLGSMEDWVYDNYGIIVPAGCINYISGDGKVVLGTSPQASAGGTNFINWYVAPPVTK